MFNELGRIKEDIDHRFSTSHIKWHRFKVLEGNIIHAEPCLESRKRRGPNRINPTEQEASSAKKQNIWQVTITKIRNKREIRSGLLEKPM
jgi:hypothetical protein